MHNIHVYTIFSISQVLLHVSMHLHHLQGVLSFYFAKVANIVKDSIKVDFIGPLKMMQMHRNM